MSAGTGVTHSEFNPSGTTARAFPADLDPPERHRIAPGYEQKRFEPAESAAGCA